MNKHITIILKNADAAVLLTVIILTMVLSVIVISVMSSNISQVKTSQSVIDEIKAEFLAKSEFQKFHQEMASTDGNSLGTLLHSSIDLDGKSFTFNEVDASGTTLRRIVFNIIY